MSAERILRRSVGWRALDHRALFHEPQEHALVLEVRKAPTALGQMRADLLIHIGGELTVEKLVELLHRALAGRLVARGAIVHGRLVQIYWSARGAYQVAEQIPVAETPPAALK